MIVDGAGFLNTLRLFWDDVHMPQTSSQHPYAVDARSFVSAIHSSMKLVEISSEQKKSESKI
jgi:hypothetical protein